MSDETIELAVRPMIDSDRSWVIDSWKRSYCHSSDGRQYDVEEDFMADYAPLIADMIDRGQVRIACLADEHAAAVAWACTEGELLHYVYVKRHWREAGVCRWFMAQLGLLDRAIVYTHRTAMCEPTRLRGARIEPDVKIPESWQYRRFKAWRKAS